MKEAVLTVRLTVETRRRLEALARREGRSLSAQVERLIQQGMDQKRPVAPRARGVRPLAGTLAGGAVPTLADFREARRLLSASLLRRTRPDAKSSR
jgi:hypothetical protein